MEILGQNIKRIRHQRKWTQEDLARASNVSVEQIKKLETEKSWISAGTIELIAKALGCPETELFLDPNSLRKPSVNEALLVLTHALSDPNLRESSDKLIEYPHQFKVTKGPNDFFPKKEPELTPKQKELLKLLPTLNEDQIDTLLMVLKLNKDVDREIESEGLKSENKKRKKS